MKNECSIIRDILPLYVENMVSEDTSEFVKEHLESCPPAVRSLKNCGSLWRCKQSRSPTWMPRR